MENCSLPHSPPPFPQKQTFCSFYTFCKFKEVSKKVKDGKNKNEQIKEIVGVKGKPDIIDITEKKRLQCYGHVKRMPEERIP
jgi:hypothetical protein